MIREQGDIPKNDSKSIRDLEKRVAEAEKELSRNKARLIYLEEKRKSQKPIADMTAIIGLVSAIIGLIKEIWL